MGKKNWRKPFVELRSKLFSIYDASQFLYHGSVLLPNVDTIDSQQLELSLSLLEAAQEDRVKVLEQDLSGTGAHSRFTHYFYAPQAATGQKAVESLAKALSGIEGWLKDIPKGLLPDFKVPICDSQRTRDLILWTSLVYHLASKIKAPYLNAVVECRRGEYYFEEWENWPQPVGYDLVPLMTHQVDPCFTIERWDEEFAEIDEQAFWLPDFVDAYLTGENMIGEFTTTSIAAVDCLLFMLQDLVEGPKRKAIQIQRTSVKRTAEQMVTQLKSYLIAVHIHNIKQVEFPRKPLKQKHIAEGIRCSQGYISKLMKEVFPPHGHKTYREFLEDNFRYFERMAQRQAEMGM